MNKREKGMLAVGLAIVAVAYVAIPLAADAEVQGAVAGMKNGFPAPVGLEDSDRLKVGAKVKLRAPDGGLDEQGSNGSGAALTEMANSGKNPGKVHEQGWGTTQSQCIKVLCSVAGDGGTITANIGGRYKVKAIDQNGSPLMFTKEAPCAAFGTGPGEILNPGEVNDETILYPAGLDAGATTTTITCCAQTATASPSGPWLELCPLQ